MTQTQSMATLLEKLEVGEKYTLWGFSEFGFPYHREITLIDAVVIKYAQYPESLLLTFKVKGKRRAFTARILPYQTFLVWKGWRPVNSDMTVSTEKRGDCIIKHSLLSFDPEYVNRALRSVSEPPILEWRKGAS